ncbi:putative uncharacterized protein DDB_G0272456, partial [Diaphorina citri]|uniref:HEAT repeat-containing protein 6 n=1 Tax=Diaphorina citri TaxID=121845 RepID=A0A3Q0JFH1_DIACI
MKTTGKKVVQTTLVQGKLEIPSAQKESRTGSRRFLQTLQQSAVDKENLVHGGGNMKDLALENEKSIKASTPSTKNKVDKSTTATVSLKDDLTSGKKSFLAVSSFKTRAKNKKKNKDKEEVEIVIVTPSPCNTQSDSDYSDSEISRLKKINASIRLTCFKLLSTILDKVNKKQIFGFISTLTMGNESLPSCLLVESSAKCRVAILSALIQIFTYSKPFLALAQFEGKTERAFVSFATLLTDVILCVHDKVLQCLQREQYASVIIHLLKCVDTLAINSPYEKLRTNLCEKLTDAVFPFVSHRDANITVVALTCFSDMVVLCSEDVLVRLCHLVFAKLQSEDSLVPVLVECWQLLSVVAKLKINLVLNYPDLWSILIKLMDHHLTWAKGSNLVQLHTVIAMQHFCQNLHSS